MCRLFIFFTEQYNSFLILHIKTDNDHDGEPWFFVEWIIMELIFVERMIVQWIIVEFMLIEWIIVE